jgi:type IV pilus assembly protein PilC
MATMLNAGITIPNALNSLILQMDDEKLKAIMGKVYKDVSTGSRLSDALARQPDTFSSFFINMVSSGEADGSLPSNFERLATSLETEYHLHKRVQSVLTYPAFVFVFLIGCTIFLFKDIFPGFSEIFKSLNIKIPLLTRFFMWVADLLNQPLFLICMAVLIGVLAFMIMNYARTPLGREHVERIFFATPVIGKLKLKTALANYFRTLGTLLENGVVLSHCLRIAGSTSGSEMIQDISYKVHNELKDGKSVTMSFRAHKIFPPLSIQMIAAGEMSANLPKMFNKLADFYEQEVDFTLRELVALMEPLMIGIMGGMVGILLIAVFMPLNQMISKL